MRRLRPTGSAAAAALLQQHALRLRSLRNSRPTAFEELTDRLLLAGSGVSVPSHSVFFF